MTDRNINIDVDKIVKHWVETSNDDFETMLTLYNSKSFGWSLFLGHISTEKLLKALYVKKFNKHAPYTHNLYRLGELIGLELTDQYSDWLDEITSFNLNARYDDYKKEFQKLCTPNYTKIRIERIKTIRKWIKEML
ncbi:MAG: HEPN domain-containing protein [Prolixibacteraceae bacterium]|nr:HEPN domain-containing protein [Prolixibacteraceae bacterium]